MTPEEQIKNLREQIAYHSDRYYNQDNPEISDYEFDQLMLELKRLEREHPELVTPDSPTQKVGGTAKRTAGVLVRHNVPMLSLQDVFSKEEIYDFVAQMKEQLDDPEFVVEYKIDGLSMTRCAMRTGSWRSRRRAATASISARMSRRMQR